MRPSKTPELLLPAGNMEKLKTALLFGADAVYLAGQELGLRAKAGNFTLEEIREAVQYAHGLGRRVYVALNIFAHNGDLPVARRYLKELAEIRPDALIISDAGLFRLARSQAPEIPVHISTQASTTNLEACRFWQDLGASRVVLGREVALKDLEETVRETGMDLEVFVHGAMCMAYSGRCMLSMYLTGRSANRGECTHPCRWSYGVVEQRRPGEYMPVEEDERGTYIFNARDLCMLEHLDRLLATGVSSLKVEGRMKSIHYVAAVARIYREALDRWSRDPENFSVDPRWTELLADVSERAYSTGFYFGSPEAEDHNYDDRMPEKQWKFCGKVLDWDGDKKLLVVEQRNRFFTGETLSALTPSGPMPQFVVSHMEDEEGSQIGVCPHPRQIIRIGGTGPLPAGTLLRQKVGALA